jgi:signal transduction histidine kinase
MQKELLEEQKNKIKTAFDELSKYRNKLEEIVEDRTRELIIAKDKAEESDRLKSSFLANLSHEIRTPLNAIIGFSSIIIEPNIAEDDRQKYNSIIQSSSNTLLSLINDIIDFSKIEAGHLDIILREVSLSKIISDIQEFFNIEIKKQYFGASKNLEFKINISKEIQSANFITDETRLKQILTNLVNNAIKFTNSGYIEVGCNLIEEKTLGFFVKDTGIGIPKEYQKIIFQRFRKIENDNINLYRGAGLGLSISQHLVLLLGGDMRVESNYGSGSVFYFSIPFNQNIENKSTIHTIPSSIPNLYNYSILVVEDDYASYSYLEKLLQKTNAKILHASNGKEAIIKYESNKNIQLILMDIKMPEMNGIEALIELKQKNIHIPVIAQTACAFYDDIKNINEAGFTDYLLKPIISNDLFKMLYKHLKVVS